MPGQREETKVVCQKCEGEMVFQPELFDPDRGHYVCGCGHRSGRVFEENQHNWSWDVVIE